MIADIPILIPIKEYSERCLRKNYDLLPFTARFIYRAGLEKNTVVITDSNELMQLASSLGLNAHLETRHPYQDELISCRNYVEQKNIECFFLCPVTQPFRHKNLFNLFETEVNLCKEPWDFMTTITKVQDRSIFYLEQKNNHFSFEKKGKNRKGSLCMQKLMIDGSLYLIKSDFLKGVLNAIDLNEAFWKGKFICVLNEAPFIDIDTKEDMEKFRFLENYFSLI